MFAPMAEGTVTEGWLHDTLEQLIAQIRALLDVTGVAFVTVDEERATIRPAAAWFTSEDASRAFTPLLDRPYDPERGGVTEAAVESGTAVLIPRVGEWPGAEGLRERLSENLDDPLAQLAWDFYATASFIAAPVRTAGGRTFGVLAISSNPPLRPLNAEDLRSVEVFARLAALALERSELLEREAGLRREEGRLNRALQAVAQPGRGGPLADARDQHRGAGLDRRLGDTPALRVVGPVEQRGERARGVVAGEPRGGGPDLGAVLVDGHERHAGDVQQHADLRDQLLERVVEPALRQRGGLRFFGPDHPPSRP